MTAVAESYSAPAGATAAAFWDKVARTHPVLAGTVRAYLAQIAVTLRPRSVEAANNTLRVFVAYLLAEQPDVTGFAQVGRLEIEGFKTWLVARISHKGEALSANTVRQRLGTLRTFFDRIIEWDWEDAPERTPIFSSDLPIVDDPLPKFLDDAQAARLMRAASETDPLTRLVIELLAHTGIRAGELCALAADSVVEMNGGWWLRVPVGKLHNDRYVPLVPILVTHLAEWVSSHPDRGLGLLLTKHGGPLNRHQVARMLNRVARAAGIEHVHPHQLRHTLATQAINRGMRVEAIAALLGHRTLRMTLIYARIANRTVADEYHAVSAKVEALYSEAPATETASMRRLRAEHRRMLANGWCNRPAEMDCAFESLCEGCGFFSTGVEFRSTITAQRDHAAGTGQDQRAERYERILEGLDQASG